MQLHDARGKRLHLTAEERRTFLAASAPVPCSRRTRRRVACLRAILALAVAHRSLPFGTLVRVTNRENGRRVVVVIDDRGPFVRGRVIDLSVAAARRLGMVRDGVASVRIKVIRWAEELLQAAASGKCG